MQVTGKIKLINAEQTFGSNGFRKRELVVTTEEQYPQSILVELYFCKRLQRLYGIKLSSVNKLQVIKGNVGKTAVFSQVHKEFHGYACKNQPYSFNFYRNVICQQAFLRQFAENINKEVCHRIIKSPIIYN